MRTSLKVATTLAALLTMPLLSACGFGLGGSGDDPERPVLGADEPAGEPGPLPDDQTVPVDGTFWHAGFQVELRQATLGGVEDAFGSPAYLLSLDAQFTNHGPDQTTFRSETVVVSGDQVYLNAWGSDLPAVPSGLTSQGTLSFEVDEAFDLAAATLVVGRDDNNQARVPLGPQGGELVDLAPAEPPVSGVLSTELLDLTITSAELRADVPVQYLEVPKGQLALTLELTATSRKGGSWSIQPSHFALILPDGNAVGVDGSQLGSLSGNDSGIDTPGLYVRFLINDPPAGEYTMRVTLPSYWNDGESTVSFTLA